MPKGGHARSGPAPDPNSLRSTADLSGWVSLPAGGRRGQTPTFPLYLVSEREEELWEELWRMPQALVWEKQRQYLEVAWLVRNMVRAEGPEAPVSIQPVIHRYMDSLGMTTSGMARNKWRIDTPAAKPTATAARAKRTSSRNRLTVVHGEDAD